MNAKALYRYFLGTFVLSIAASFLLVRYAANWLTESSVELSTLRNDVTNLEQRWANLERAKITLSEQSDDVETLSYVLPEDKDQARVVKEIYAIADQANVVIDSVGFPSSTLGSTAPKAAPATTATTEPATSSTSATTSDQTATQATPTATKTISQATPIKDIPGVQSIELSIGTITSKDKSIKGIRYDEMINLLKLIERNRRTMQIRSIGIGQTLNQNGAPSYDLTLSIVIFIQP